MLKDIEDIKDLTDKETRDMLYIGKMIAIGTICSGFIHELNQPLTGIMGFSQLLAGTPISIEQAKDFGILIEKQTTRMDILINKMKEFVKNDLYQFELLNLNQCINDTLAFFAFHMRKYNIALINKFEEKKIQTCYYNSNQLQQLLIHIISDSVNILKDMGGKKEIIVNIDTGSGLLFIKIVVDAKDVSQGQKLNIYKGYISPDIASINNRLNHFFCRLITSNHKGKIEILINEDNALNFIITLPL